MRRLTSMQPAASFGVAQKEGLTGRQGKNEIFLSLDSLTFVELCVHSALYATRASLQLLRSVRIGKQRLCRPVGRSVGRTPMFIGAVQRTELSAGTAQLSSSCNQRPRRETRTSSAASPARQRLQSKTIIISLIYIVLLLRRIAEVGRSVGRPAGRPVPRS